MINPKTIHRKETFYLLIAPGLSRSVVLSFFFFLQVIIKSVTGTCAYSFTYFLYVAATRVRLSSNYKLSSLVVYICLFYLYDKTTAGSKDLPSRFSKRTLTC